MFITSKVDGTRRRMKAVFPLKKKSTAEASQINFQLRNEGTWNVNIHLTAKNS